MWTSSHLINLIHLTSMLLCTFTGQYEISYGRVYYLVVSFGQIDIVWHQKTIYYMISFSRVMLK